jgi:SH3-like domain-containing protein
VIRFIAQFSLSLALVLSASTAFAAPDQPDPSHTRPAATKPAPRKAAPAKTAKTAHKAGKTAAGKPKVPAVKAPAEKSAQPPAATQAGPVKAPEVKSGDAKTDGAKSDGAKPVETKAAPHFASLRAEKVNLRSGPSEDFPIQWVFKRRGLPVEILASFDIWRKIHAFDGTEGWVNQQMLTGRRSVLITGATRNLHHDPDPASGIVAQLEPGVVAAMSHCNPTWCELKAGGYKGWLKRDGLWGVEPDEIVP